MRAIFTFGIVLVLVGCSTPKPEVQTRIVEIPSSKPYRYITFSDKDDPDTIRQVKRHNRAHQEVINTEKAAKAAKSN
jgi:hypothetical protein